jgi:dipeptidase D
MLLEVFSPRIYPGVLNIEQGKRGEDIMASITIRIPDWLDKICTWPILLYRLWKYGYTFRKIYLGEGEWTILEPQDYYRFGSLKWCATGDDECVYAARIIKKTVCGRVKSVYLHREIMDPPKGLLVDHKNGDTLDNRKANLRLATHSQNVCNSNSRIDKSKTVSRFRGLVFLKRKKKWGARITYHGKVIWLGTFTNEIDAAKAYDAAARKYHGEFARLNFSEENRNIEIRNTKYEQRTAVARPQMSRYNANEGLLINRTLMTICCILFAIIAFAGCIACKNSAVSRSVEMLADKKMTLKQSKAKNVWEMFRQVSAIPRCSKNEGQIIEWLKNFAKSRNLACRSDAVNNVIIELPPTKGYENAPAVVLQSHVDMVCEKTPESRHDFTKDPIELIERDGWVTANGTTLGADNGVGVALALALVEEKLPHPKLELLFTVDEETGLTGANGLQPGFITGKYLINLDGENKSLIVGCAGGENAVITMKLEWVDAPANFDCFTLKVSGLHGGHSGVDIDKQRANAIQLLTRTIRGLRSRFDLRICSIDGGKASNAIPRDAGAVVYFDRSTPTAIKQQIAELESSFKNEFVATDPNLKVELIKATEHTDKIINNQLSIINLLSNLPTGVYRLSQQFKGTVETSNNLARVETVHGENLLRITTMQRGFELSGMADLTDKITCIADLAGAKVEASQRYPAWKPDTNSTLLKRAKEVYKKIHNKEPEARVVHAGLEPAVIGEKFPGIEMISVGPTIQNPHSPQERVEIASVDAVWKFLLELIPSLK